MSNNNNNNSGGAGFVSLLTLLFIGLKLTGYITWSWWWILSPILVATGLLTVLIILISILDD